MVGTHALLERLDPYVPDDFISQLCQRERTGGRRHGLSAAQLWRVHLLALVRLRRREDRVVEVRSCAVKNRGVSNRNCVAVMRGGEQRNENDQSVTQTTGDGRRRELDSVGVDGRAFE
jgi:hypothetical protein